MQNTLAELLEKYKQDTITPSEWQQLREIVLSQDSQDSVQQDILSQLEQGAPPAGWDRAKADVILQSILSSEETNTRPANNIRYMRKWPRYAAAVVIILVA